MPRTSFATTSQLDKAIIATSAAIAWRFVHEIQGLEHIAVTQDPFILVANHASRREALILPPLLFQARGGKRIHFVADWNFQLIPGIGWLNRRAEVITTTRKSARPKLLNIFKPLFAEPGTVLDRAKQCLLDGRSVGIFPEGTVNRNQERLLTGQRGAARLSLETGAAIVPVGIRLTPAGARSALTGGGFAFHIGAPLYPSDAAPAASPQDCVRAWHAVIMRSIERLSGKTWYPHRGAQR